MGAAVDHDMQKSFARATGGPASMRGGKVGEDTIVTEVYRAAETKREEERVEAAKRTKKAKPDSGKLKKSDKSKRKKPNKPNSKRPSSSKRQRMCRQSEVLPFEISCSMRVVVLSLVCTLPCARVVFPFRNRVITNLTPEVRERFFLVLFFQSVAVRLCVPYKS
jgi:hypothetical protein